MGSTGVSPPTLPTTLGTLHTPEERSTPTLMALSDWQETWARYSASLGFPTCKMGQILSLARVAARMKGRSVWLGAQWDSENSLPLGSPPRVRGPAVSVHSGPPTAALPSVRGGPSQGSGPRGHTEWAVRGGVCACSWTAHRVHHRDCLGGSQLLLLRLLLRFSVALKVGAEPSSLSLRCLLPPARAPASVWGSTPIRTDSLWPPGCGHRPPVAVQR